MIILNYAGGPPKSLRVLGRRAAYDTTLRKRRKPQDYGDKLEGHCHSQEHLKPPGARVGSPPQLSEGAQLGSSLALRPLTLKDMGVFVGPTLWRSVTMATGQTDSREDDSPAKRNVQGLGVLYILGKLSSQQPGHSKLGPGCSHVWGVWCLHSPRARS